jgi:hypothetical protein
VIRCGGAYTKDATGYDLTHLLVGSEGTLALIVEATLKLTPLPVSQAGLRVLYRDADAAAAAVSRLMSQPVVPTRLEFMDARSLELLRLNGADVPEAGAMLLVEADGDHDTLPYLLQALASAAEGDGMIELDVAMEGRARDQLWAARKALSPALRSVAPGKINEDVVVPVSRIPELVAGVQALARDYTLTIVTFGHAGNGNLHVNILYHPDDADENARAHAALPRIFELTLAWAARCRANTASAWPSAISWRRPSPRKRWQRCARSRPRWTRTASSTQGAAAGIDCAHCAPVEPSHARLLRPDRDDARAVRASRAWARLYTVVALPIDQLVGYRSGSAEAGQQHAVAMPAQVIIVEEQWFAVFHRRTGLRPAQQRQRIPHGH